ncbi:STAS domain-containing protein [Thiomicrorhabdus sp. Milos-T2]|uniref:STAS domain-containing protein n=1 Tax=Thiomicrorhabdus sp. Milos-T2 TaxID=90814 RepID=UPI0004944AAB|nr:STAS domain-containing protein [Thiomicrorhabdus sp. Milos-T2]
MPENVAVSRKQIGGEIPMVVSEISDRTIYTGLFGSIDSARIAEVSDKLIACFEIKEVDYVIMDLGNVDVIDSSVSGYLLRLADTLVLLGITPIFCGIKGYLAESMVKANVNLKEHIIKRNLKAALSTTYEMSGKKIVDINE